MDDHPTPDPAGQALHLRYRVTTGFDPFPGVTVAWYQAVGVRPEDGAYIALDLEQAGQRVVIQPLAVGRAVMRIADIPFACIDARRGSDGLLVPFLRARDDEPLPGILFNDAQRLMHTWSNFWETIKQETDNDKSITAVVRRGPNDMPLSVYTPIWSAVRRRFPESLSHGNKEKLLLEVVKALDLEGWSRNRRTVWNWQKYQNYPLYQWIDEI